MILSDVDGDGDYYGAGFLQDICETALMEIGGQELLDDAHFEACAYVDQYHPWDGHGDEPVDRVSAYCAVLWQNVQSAGESRPAPE